MQKKLALQKLKVKHEQRRIRKMQRLKEKQLKAENKDMKMKTPSDLSTVSVGVSDSNTGANTSSGL